MSVLFSPKKDLTRIIQRVVELAGPRRQVLKVETYNGEPALQSLSGDTKTDPPGDTKTDPLLDTC